MFEFYFFLLIGGFLIVLEILLGFVVVWFFFFGIACVLTAFSVYFFPGWESALAFFSAYTIASVVLMLKWVRPKLLQSKQGSGNDIIGQIVEVTRDILPGTQGGSVRWSGVSWKARLAEGAGDGIIGQGTSANVVSVSGTTLFVRPSEGMAAPQSPASGSASADESPAPPAGNEPPNADAPAPEPKSASAEAVPPAADTAPAQDPGPAETGKSEPEQPADK